MTRTIDVGPVWENRRAGLTCSGVKHSFVVTTRDENGVVKTSRTYTAASLADAEYERSRIILGNERKAT